MDDRIGEEIAKTLYRMNGTLMSEGDVGRQLLRIADALEELTKPRGILEKINWNLGTIANKLKEG